MICQDGFITSHAVENIELIEDEKVRVPLSASTSRSITC